MMRRMFRRKTDSSKRSDSEDTLAAANPPATTATTIDSPAAVVEDESDTAREAFEDREEDVVPEDDHQDEEDDEEDLEAMLNDMDISRDFSMNFSFGSEHSDRLRAADRETSLENVAEEPEEEKWQDREEIYSRLYSPSKTERERLESMSTMLGVRPSFQRGAVPVENDGGQTVQNQWDRIVTSTPQHPLSIVLKAGFLVLVEDDIELECQFFSLTRGFFIVAKEATKNFMGFSSGIHSLLGCSRWTAVQRIKQSPYKNLFQIQCGQDSCFTLKCNSTYKSWLQNLQEAATKAHSHFLDTSKSQCGWQYRLMQVQWYTEACTGDTETDDPTEGDVGQEVAEDTKELDCLDIYKSYAPLHYAAQLNHVNAIRLLLDAGANPNVKDGEGKTPIYYAQIYRHPESTLTLLESFGAQRYNLDAEQRGELFGAVATVEKQRAEREEAKMVEAELEAKRVQSQMANNIAAMQQRGEQIEELGDKAEELNQNAAEYGDMASQLKAKMKQKARGGVMGGFGIFR